MCEAESHQDNSFITLTYAGDPGGLDKSHLRDFFKRFRYKLGTIKIRYFAVGEYGSENHRAHWHAVIFGWCPDRSDAYDIKGRKDLVGSHLLDSVWSGFDPDLFGYASAGELTPASAGYVSQYAMKKITGPQAVDSYTDADTGEICLPEFAVMSRGGRKGHGIGYEWIKAHMGEAFPSDSVYFSKGLVKPPKYFFELLKAVDPALAQEVTDSRRGKFSEEEYYRLVLDGVADKVLRSRLSASEKRHKEL